MQLKEDIKIIKTLEQEKEEKQNQIAEVLKVVDVLGNNSLINSKNEIEKLIEKELYQHQEDLKNIEKELKEKQTYLINKQREIGNDINDYIEGINEEIKIYCKNKKLNNLIEMKNNVKQKILQIDELSEFLILINNYKEGIDPEIKEDPNSDDIIEIIKCIESELTEEYILPQNLELSQYTLNNKQGYSLKNFGADYKNEILKVLNHYEWDVEKTINYLQRIHGLCPGSKIEVSSFKQCCYDLFKKPIELEVKLNNQIIVGASLKDIFINTLEKIGISTVYKRCSIFFNNYFKITTVKPRENHVTRKDGNNMYYIIVNSMNNQTIKQILNKIKNQLYIKNMSIV